MFVFATSPTSMVSYKSVPDPKPRFSLFKSQPDTLNPGSQGFM